MIGAQFRTENRANQINRRAAEAALHCERQVARQNDLLQRVRSPSQSTSHHCLYGRRPASILGLLEFNCKLNYDGIPNPPLDKTDKNKRPPSDYFRSKVLVDTMGFDPIGVKAAIEMCGIDRVMFGTDFGPVPFGVKEHIDRRSGYSRYSRSPESLFENQQ